MQIGRSHFGSARFDIGLQRHHAFSPSVQHIFGNRIRLTHRALIRLQGFFIFGNQQGLTRYTRITASPRLRHLLENEDVSIRIEIMRLDRGGRASEAITTDQNIRLVRPVSHALQACHTLDSRY